MQTLDKELNLLPDEWAALLYRLGEPGCIVDALTDDADSTYHPQDVETVVEMLAAGRLSDALGVCEGIVHAVLRDTIEGSTYAASEFDPQRARPEHNAACRALEGAARKVGAFIGAENLKTPLR